MTDESVGSEVASSGLLLAEAVHAKALLEQTVALYEVALDRLTTGHPSTGWMTDRRKSRTIRTIQDLVVELNDQIHHLKVTHGLGYNLG